MDYFKILLDKFKEFVKNNYLKICIFGLYVVGIIVFSSIKLNVSFVDQYKSAPERYVIQEAFNSGDNWIVFYQDLELSGEVKEVLISSGEYSELINLNVEKE